MPNPPRPQPKPGKAGDKGKKLPPWLEPKPKK
jgi:hypothetical protein